MPFPPKKLGWLDDHLADFGIHPDATRVKPVLPGAVRSVLTAQPQSSVGPQDFLAKLKRDKLATQMATGTDRFAPGTAGDAITSFLPPAFAMRSGLEAARALSQGHPGAAALAAAIPLVPVEDIPGVSKLTNGMGSMLKSITEGGERTIARSDPAIARKMLFESLDRHKNIMPAGLADSVVMRATLPRSKAPVRIVGGDLSKLTPGMQAMKDSRGAIEQRVQQALEMTNAPVPTDRPQPLGLIDRSVIKPYEGPTTTPLPERLPFGPRQAAGHMKSGIDTPVNRDLIIRQVQRGQRMMPSTFYPSHAAVMSAIGDAGGDPNLFANAATGAAIRNGPVGELVGGSAMQYALKRGVLNADEMALGRAGDNTTQFWNDMGKRVRDLFKQDFPQAKGLQLMGVHPQAFNALQFGPAADAYKIPTYGAQKFDRSAPGFVLDTHEAKGGTITSPFHRLFADQGGFATQGEYGAQERFYRSIAQEMGLSDAELQEARWRGGGNITGLRSAPNADYGQIFEDLVSKNAQNRGLDPKKLLRDVALGNNTLWLP